MTEPVAERFLRWRSERDPEDLDAVFRATAPALVRAALHLVGDAHAAEDLVQQTFLVAIESAEDYDPARPLEPWLAGILFNRVRRLRRDRGRALDPERLERAWEALDPVDAAALEELDSTLEAAIDRLPEAYRQPVLLRLKHGLEPSEIAHVLDRAPGTVRVQLHRGLEQLRERMPPRKAYLLGPLLALEFRFDDVRRRVLDAARRASAPGRVGGLGLPLGALLGGAVRRPAVLAVLAVVGTLGLVLPWLGGRARPGDELVADLPRPEEAAAVDPSREVELRSVEPESSSSVGPARAAVDPGGATFSVRLDRPSPQIDRPEGILSTTDLLGRVHSRRVRFDEEGMWREEGLTPGLHYFFPAVGAPVQLELAAGERGGKIVRAGYFQTLALEVVDADGAPIPGAVVANRNGNQVRLDLGRTDALGRFESPGMFSRVTIEVHAPGYEKASLVLPNINNGRAERQVVLDSPGVDVSGTLYAPDGTLAEAAWVICTREDGFLKDLTRADGKFRFEGLAVGESVRVEAQYSGIGYARLDFDALGAVPSTDLRVDLSRSGVVAGRVLDAEGRPLHGMLVSEARSYTHLRTWSAADGTFELAGLPTETEILLVARANGRAMIPALHEVRFDGPGRVEWSPVLQDAGTARVQLVESDGSPAIGSIVSIRLPGEERMHSQEETDPEGRAAMPVIADVDQVELFVEYGQQPGTGLQLGPFLLDVDVERTLVLPDRTPLAARIVGTPAESDRDANIELELYLARLDSGPPLPATRTRLIGGAIELALDHLRPGDWLAAVRRLGHSPKILGWKRVGAGETWELGPITSGPPGDDSDAEFDRALMRYLSGESDE